MIDIKTILYATDLGKGSRPVLRFAVSLAQKYDAKIIMLHALEPLSSYGRTLLDTYLPKESAEKIEQEGLAKVTEIMSKRLHKFCEEELGSGTTESDFIQDIVVINAKSAIAIRDESEKCKADIIVMGTHSQSRLGEMFMGSTARRVTQISNIPVLIVPIIPT